MHGPAAQFYAMSDMAYYSPQHFSAVFATQNTLTLAGLAFAPSSNQFMEVRVSRVGGAVTVYSSASFNMSYNSGTGVLTVTDAVFLATDTAYRVVILGEAKAYSAAGNYLNQSEVAPLNQVALTETLINSTNVAAATVQLPSASGMSMLGFAGLSISGQLIDVTSLIVEATDDDSGTLWHQVYFYDCVNNAVINSIASAGVTTNFAISLDNCNFHSVRLTYVTPDATNTLNIRCRRTY